MADREKLLDGLHCRATNFPEKDCAHCYYGIQMGRRWGCDFRRMTEDALALLKAQEAVRPGLGIIHHEDGSKSYFLHCPLDGTTLVDGDNYCRRCGRAMKWE